MTVEWESIISDYYATLLNVKKEDVQGPPVNFRYRILGLCGYDLMTDEGKYKTLTQIFQELSNLWCSLK